MSANSKNLFKANSQVAPQFFDESKDDWVPQKGSGGSSYVHVTNNPVVEDYWEGSTSITKTFPEPMRGVSIANDGLETLTFTINGVTRTIYPGEPYTGTLKNFTQITINAKDKYRAEVLK